MTEPLVQISGLSWRYSIGGWVLRDIDLSIHAGERIGLVGRSGSGKSTLALTLNGTIPQSYAGGMKGQVVVLGRDTATTPVPDLASGVAVVFQSPDDQMSQILVQHEVASGPANQQLSTEEVQRGTRDALVQLGIEHLVKRETGTLSGGEKQKVALAAALAMKPELLVLDEPTTDLDPRSKQEMVELLKGLDDEVTIVAISHDIDTLSPLVDRLVILEEGEVVADGFKSAIFRQPEVLEGHGIAVPQVVVFNHLMRKRYPNWPITASIEETANFLGYLPSSTIAIEDESPSLGEEVIRLEGVSFQYPESDTMVIKNISLFVREGEMVAIIGNNGAGKTTLSKLILGLLRPMGGRIVVLGEEVRGIRPDRVGYIFQNPDAMFCCMSVEEEVGFTLKSLGLSWWREAAEANLKALSLGDLRSRFPLSLSKGQRQKVAYAAVSAAQPPILIFDEPTTGIDRPGCEAIMRYMDELRRGGRAVLFVTHDMILASQWADRIIVMNDGEIVFDAPPRQLLAMDGERLSELHLALPPISELAMRLGLPVGVLKPEELIALVREVAR